MRPQDTENQRHEMDHASPNTLGGVWGKAGEVESTGGEEMTEEEMLDETLRESFPASDPPGHISKSKVDKQTH